MSDLSMFSFTGRLTKDSTFKTINTTGKSVMNFDIAINTGWGDNKKVTYVKVAYWGPSGERLTNFFTKGKTAAVAGELYTNSWVGKDGTPHTDICVDAKSIQLVGNAPQQLQQADSPQPPAEDENTFPEF